MDDPAEVTLADAFGIDIEAICALPEFVLGQEPLRYRSRPLIGNYMPAAELDAILGPYEADIRAGVPARIVGRRLGLSASVVSHWRRAKKIERRPGPAKRGVEARFLARTLVANAPPAVAHETTALSHGTWSMPEYVLREPLHYDTLVDIVGVLVEAGMAVERIAAGVGIAVRDVQIALEVHARESAG